VTTTKEPLIKASGRNATMKNKKGKQKKLMKKQLRKKSNITVDAEKDPINSLGFGIVAYRDLLYSLIWIFSAFSILMLPTIYIYQNGSGYAFNEIPGKEIYSLGNLGYTSVQCASMPLGV
jgi:hypothetical protein